MDIMSNILLKDKFLSEKALEFAKNDVKYSKKN